MDKAAQTKLRDLLAIFLLMMLYKILGIASAINFLPVFSFQLGPIPVIFDLDALIQYIALMLIAIEVIWMYFGEKPQFEYIFIGYLLGMLLFPISSVNSRRHVLLRRLPRRGDPLSSEADGTHHASPSEASNPE